jgi:hypothetical protein
MRKLLLPVLVFAVGGSAARAIDFTDSPGPRDVRFAAVSVTDSEGVRAVVSNVLAYANVDGASSCSIVVKFFGADGALMGEATSAQIRAGESISVPASDPSGLVRAIVSVDGAADSAKSCILKTSLEVFDARSGTTFVSVPGEAYDNHGECGTPIAPSSGIEHTNAPGQVHRTARSSKSSPLYQAARNLQTFHAP